MIIMPSGRSNKDYLAILRHFNYDGIYGFASKIMLKRDILLFSIFIFLDTFCGYQSLQ